MNRERQSRRLVPPLLALLLLLAACGGGDAGDTTALPGATATTAPTPRRVAGAVARPGETVETGRIIVTLHALADPAPAAGSDRPRAGTRWIAADLEIATTRTLGRQPYSAESAILETTAGRHAAVPHGPAPVLRSGVITSTGPVRGWVTFEAPAEATVPSLRGTAPNSQLPPYRRPARARRHNDREGGYQTASCHSITPYASRSAPHPGSVPLKAPNGWR